MLYYRMKPTIITEIRNFSHFQEIWINNPGVLIIKFGATWCGPCKQIEPLVNECISKMSDNVQCVIIDIDECFELYAFLKKKRVLSGVPVIIGYYKSKIVDKDQTTFFYPEEMVIGADKAKVIEFFNRCYNESNKYVTV